MLLKRRLLNNGCAGRNGNEDHPKEEEIFLINIIIPCRQTPLRDVYKPAAGTLSSLTNLRIVFGADRILSRSTGAGLTVGTRLATGWARGKYHMTLR